MHTCSLNANYLSLVTWTQLTWGLPGGLQGTSKHGIKWLQHSLFGELFDIEGCCESPWFYVQCLWEASAKKKSWETFKNVAGKVMTCDSNKEITVFLSPGFGKGSLAAMCGISLECFILHPVLGNTVGKAPRVWLIKIATTCLSV